MSTAATLPPLTTHPWEVVPQGLFSRHYDLQRDGITIATLKMSFWSEGCEFTIAGLPFAIRRKSMLKDAFELVAGDQSVCEVKRGFWSRRFEITAADEAWALEPSGWFTRNYRLTTRGRELGSIRPAGWFTRKRVADFDSSVPPPIQVLAIFLVVIISQRQQKSAAG